MPFDSAEFPKVETDFLTEDDVEAARILREAADYIREHGWCQDSLSSPSGRVCAIGAIKSVTMPDIRDGWADDARHTTVVFGRFVYRRYNDVDWSGFGHVPDWNDTPGRTKEEVISALNDCAAWLEAGRPT